MDCPACKGNGYVVEAGQELPCSECAGKGLLEKEVPYKFDGPRTKEEKAAIFGVSEADYKDEGHDIPSRGASAE